MHSDITDKENPNTLKYRRLSCFISSPAGVDLSSLLSVLAENSIYVLESWQLLSGAVNVSEKIIDSISRADLFIGILKGFNPNVMYELGCAKTLGKQVLMIIPDDSNMPSDLMGLTYIRSDLDNTEAIDFALQRLLDAPPEKQQVRKNLSITTQPLGHEKVDLLLNKFSKINSNHFSEKQVSDLVRKTMEWSGISVISEPRYVGIRPDFAIWIDELEPYFGNPILVEVKKDLNVSKAHAALEQSLQYINISKTRAILIISSNISMNVTQDIIGDPYVFFFDLTQLLQSLRDKSLSEVILKRRNRMSHRKIG